MTQSESPLSRFLAEACQDLDGLFLDDTTAAPGSAPLTARKLSVYVPVSCCYLTDSTGQNHCQHPPRVVTPAPWTWRRARNRAAERWWDLRERVARALAGRRWPDEEES